ncbi:hypothetical protein HBI56_134700 [Parastagonospora nodorum]|uniref:Uncharacterized protein n=1 Tax=Phaeosphaeria nodorum (strain SN15 / ATCC MYA-4574 / FGSC 10173) TaxID=321614 RepID=A0A7U2I2Z7_PHANO|nr:hypothetical protein HBH56_037800 [Parastagonospora nodorum]QRC99914.1 hypothetical protein JI435_414260 [Parastagonospora nodorum SN15]KAH3933574.1 hypothetical protein HBH54_061660 [Parastagonospora nodorum]KAH3952469.1 hypothetical protein HBH53_048450 [Parastagonospora nodorum]KAH3979642.1 hypothetical protein HBH51_059450 [Parastagonospora nodorum]
MPVQERSCVPRPWNWPALPGVDTYIAKRSHRHQYGLQFMFLSTELLFNTDTHADGLAKVPYGAPLRRKVHDLVYPQHQQNYTVLLSDRRHWTPALLKPSTSPLFARQLGCCPYITPGRSHITCSGLPLTMGMVNAMHTVFLRGRGDYTDLQRKRPR